MLITVYKFAKKVNSTAIPRDTGVEINVYLKDDTSIFNPVFTVSGFGTEYNYIKWDNRYYYITDFVIVRNSVYEISCAMDMLATYRTNIKDSIAFVEYSTSDYNVNIPDTRLRVSARETTAINSGLLLTDADVSGIGTYILNYVTDNPNYGATGLIYGDGALTHRIRGMLTDTGFLDLENFEKQFTNAYSRVIGLKYVPFMWYNYGTGVRIHLGSYDTGINAQGVTLQHKYSVTVAVPNQFTDFRKTNPYTTLLMYLPRYGLVEINPLDIYNKSSLTVNLVVDGVTGEGTYTIDNIFKGTTNFGVSMAIGTVSGNAQGIVSGALQRASGRIVQNPLALGMGVADIVASASSRSVGNVGSLGSLSSALASIGDDWRKVYFISICHNTTVEPSSVRDNMGSPLGVVKSLNNLSGYVQTTNANVVTPYNDISEQINNLLNGGVYLE